MNNITTVKLTKGNDYAIIAPGQIIYALNKSDKELEEAKLEIYENTKDYKTSKPIDRVLLGIIPTFDCNLKCIYCYSNGGDSKEVITMETVIKAMNHIRKTKKEAKVLDLCFLGGGEPLLNLDLIKEIVNYADLLFENVEIHVVTNGTFGTNVLSWLIDRKANIRISYDAVGQDFQRPFYNNNSSKRIVETNIKKLILNGISPTIQCTITSQTVNKMIEIINTLIKLEVKAVKIEPCVMTDVSRGTKSLQPNPITFANKLVEVIEYVANNDLPISINTNYFSKPSNGKYCGMGHGNFTVTPEGMITSCIEIAKKNDPYSDKLMIGKIGEKVEIFAENIEILNKLDYIHQNGGCSICQFRLICLGGCPMANIWENGLTSTKSKFTCAIEHTLLPTLLLKIVENEKIMNVIMENPEKIYNRDSVSNYVKVLKR